MKRTILNRIVVSINRNIIPLFPCAKIINIWFVVGHIKCTIFNYFHTLWDFHIFQVLAAIKRSILDPSHTFRDYYIHQFKTFHKCSDPNGGHTVRDTYIR